MNRLPGLSLLLAFGFFAVASSPVQAQRGLKDIPNPDPAAELGSFQVADGFEVQLFAAEPMIAKPIQMNWDTAGRLWIATSETYPHIKPGQKANDKIIVLEDTTGDGRADKQTVFADGLLMPTAILPGDGGVYVGASTELLFLRDTDGDGQADEKRVVLSGFGTEDTHHMIHTLRRGPAGDVYFNQSIYTHSHLETPFGVKRLLAGGTWQMLPRTIQMSVYTRGLINPWGLMFDEWGQSFETDGAGSEGIHYVFPGMVMRTAYNAERIVPGLNPGQPKHCGLELLTGEHLPEGWAGRVVTNDFRGNRINSFQLTPSGSGYASVQAENLLTSNHVAFRPIDILMGPDGAIYVADWYNPIIQHGEVDFRDERRDQERGRIWRIAPKTLTVSSQTRPADCDTGELLELLLSDQKWWRDAARTELMSRPQTEVLPAALQWTEQQTAAAGQALLEGLWLQQGLGSVDAQHLTAALESDNFRVRAAAIRCAAAVLPSETQLPLLQKTARDPHLQPRLETTHALKAIATPEALRICAELVNPENDRFLDFALWQAFRDHEAVWLPALAASPDWQDLTVPRLLFLAQAARSPDVLTALLDRVWGSDSATSQLLPPLLPLLAERGTASQLQLIWDRLAQLPTELQKSSLEMLATAASQRNIKPAEGRQKLLALLTTPQDSRQQAACRLAGAWKLTEAADALVKLVDSQESAALRIAALNGLAGLGGPVEREFIAQLATGKRNPELQIPAISVQAGQNILAAAEAAIALLATARPEAEIEAILQPFVSRKEGPAALVRSLQNRPLPAATAIVGVRLASRLTQPQPQLVAAFQKAGGLDPVSPEMSPAERDAIVQAVRELGSAERGEEIYRRENLQCIKCHAIGGSGGKVGPDLTSIGASAPVDYLLESLLEPNKKIKEGYHTLQIITVDGLVKAGVPVLQNQQEVHLRDVEGKIQVIPTDDIEVSQMSPVSLMPAELVSKLPRNELIDLVRFLAALGKTGELVVGQQRFVRTWEVLVPGDRSKEVTDVIRHNGPQQAATSDPALPWGAAYSHVDGSLTLTPLAWMSYIEGKNLQFARFSLEVTAAGEIGLKIADPTALRIWIDEREIPVTETISQSLSTGTHRVTIAIEGQARPNPRLQIELIDIPDSSGQARLIN